MPARVEADQAGGARELERAPRAAGREKTQDGDDALAQPGEFRMNRKSGLVRVDRVLKPDVEKGLVPNHVRVVRQTARRMREGLFFWGGRDGGGGGEGEWEG